MKPRLKNLELHGYKTFAGRVMFAFPGNITAIVGPNGSGKSNIADALRWVLGEQSYSLLRGKKTEDMIFLGSDQRPRAGMASATITFDNEDGWLPIDYSEVAITRRAYRDGSNEYLLNRQKVRLKDISELLAQSGLAERTYTIIGQGLVDAALSLRPEERRRFFEEAAGIGLFRSRREESLTRLDTTHRNLERITDILSELEPRLKSLERQARRVEEFERVKTDLQVLLKDWYGYHWQNTQKEFLHNREVLKNQEERVNSARQKRLEIEKQVETARTRLQELRETLNQLHGESARLHSNREEVSRRVAVLDERVHSYQAQLVALQNDLGKIQEQAESQAQQLDNLLKDKERLAEELDESREQQKSARESVTERQAEQEKIQADLQQERKELVKAETQQVQLKAHLGELNSRLDSLLFSRQNAVNQFEKTRFEIEDALVRVERFTKEQETATENANGSEKGITELHEQEAALESKSREINDQIGKTQAEIARNAAQLEVLLQAEDALTGMGEGAKSLISAVKSGKLRGNFKAFSDTLEVPAEMEIAVSSALGELLDAILLGADVDVDRTLDFFAEEHASRAVLVQERALTKTETLNNLKGPGVLGIASDHVKVSGEVSSPIKRLLSQILVVKDRVTAKALVGRLPMWGRIVTLQGEVFNGNGVIVAGREKRSGIISRKREKGEIQGLLKSLDERKIFLMKEVERNTEQLSALQTKKPVLQKTFEEDRTKLRSVTQEFESASRSLEQLRQRAEWQKTQMDTLQEQITTTTAEVDGNKQESEISDLVVNALRLSLEKLTESLKLIPIDEMQSQLVHWNTTVAVNERATRDVDKRYAESAQLVTQSRESLALLTGRIEELRKSLQSSEGEKESAKNEEVELNRSIALAGEKIEPAEKELISLESGYFKLQHEYSVAQQFEGNADRVNSAAQLELSRSRESLETLRRKIEEDFGLVTLEYSEDITGPTPLPLEGVSKLVTLTEIPRDLEESINRQRSLLRRMGAINPEARSEYNEVRERHDFLSTQLTDLQKAEADLRQIITELDEMMHQRFRETFSAVAAEFKEMFTRLFGGGYAKLLMTDEDNPTLTGIDIQAKLPGRREQGLSLLSGGERALTAVALIFSLLKASPTPFCVLDEVDAMLDEANVGRFTELLKELNEQTQFVVITHNRNTVQTADVIYGVTMGRDSASQVISLKLDEVSDDLVK